VQPTGLTRLSGEELMLVWLKLVTVWVPFMYGVLKDIAPCLSKRYKAWKNPVKDDDNGI